MKNITFEMLEDKICKWFIKYNDYPRYIILDKSSYDSFNNLAVPTERTMLYGEQNNKPFAISKFHSASNCSLDILRVDTDQTLFEIVG